MVIGRTRPGSRSARVRRLAGVRSAGSILAGHHGHRAHDNGAVVLAYHDVLPAAKGYHVTSGRLRAHLELVRRSGHRLVDLAHIVDRLERGESVSGLAAVTFDDGLIGVATDAAPVLEDLGVTATIFVVTEAMGKRPAWWQGAARTISAAELADLIRTPQFSAASHSRTHRSLPELADDELDSELVGSRRRLEDLLGSPVRLLAYPSGHHDARVRAAAQRAGYRAAFTFHNGRVTPDLDRYRLPRFTMGSHHRRLRLAAHLARPSAAWPDTPPETRYETRFAALAVDPWT